LCSISRREGEGKGERKQRGEEIEGERGKERRSREGE
jgi:hypothetical protein